MNYTGYILFKYNNIIPLTAFNVYSIFKRRIVVYFVRIGHR